MNNIYKYLGLLNESGLPSAHKLTGLSATIMLAYTHFKVLNADNATTFLIVDWLVVMLALGRVTFSQILQLKNGEKQNQNDKP